MTTKPQQICWVTHLPWGQRTAPHTAGALGNLDSRGVALQTPGRQSCDSASPSPAPSLPKPGLRDPAPFRLESTPSPTTGSADSTALAELCRFVNYCYLLSQDRTQGQASSALTEKQREARPTESTVQSHGGRCLLPAQAPGTSTCECHSPQQGQRSPEPVPPDRCAASGNDGAGHPGPSLQRVHGASINPRLRGVHFLPSPSWLLAFIFTLLLQPHRRLYDTIQMTSK